MVLAGRDIVASAQTGTGKTAAFALPALQLVAGAKGKGPHAARGHAHARARGADREGRLRGLREDRPARGSSSWAAPSSTARSRSSSAGCDLLVATPGRLIDLMEHNHVSLKQVKVLVLDEADRMLDMGFWPSVRRIMHALPAEHQTLLFSATIPPSIKSTIDALLTDPATVEIARVGETADTVEEHLCPVTQGQKTELLRALLDTGGAAGEKPEREARVLPHQAPRVDDVSKTLKNAGVKVDVMHADRPQKARERALEKFREGKCQVLVATDVMSRGIDVSGIDAVVNFDVPMDPEDYVHRIGRTGRAGATGHAYTFVAPDEISPLREIEYFTKKLVPVWDLPDFAYDSGRIVPQEGRPHQALHPHDVRRLARARARASPAVATAATTKTCPLFTRVKSRQTRGEEREAGTTLPTRHGHPQGGASAGRRSPVGL